MAKMVEVKCKNCGKPKMVRMVDVQRGWGKFCSKSCKAKEQEKRTGQYKEYINRQTTRSNAEDYEHPFSGEALGQE